MLIENQNTQEFDTPAKTDAVGESNRQEGEDFDEGEQRLVKSWLGKIARAEAKWAPDFKLMRQCQEFVRGLQREGQKEIDCEEYTNNVTIKMVNQKVATLYAKNPEIDVKRRPRMDFVLWDETQEMLNAVGGITARQEAEGGAMAVHPEAMAVLNDYQRGKDDQKMIDKVCMTLDYLLTYIWDYVRPDFKEQLKSVVRRVITCGVAYARPIWVDDSRPEPGDLNLSDPPSSMKDRALRAELVLKKLREGEIEANSAEIEQLKSMVMSIGTTMEKSEEAYMTRRLEYDFPPSTSIIPDEGCRSLKEFVGCHWIAQRYRVPLDLANAFFGTNILATAEMKGDSQQDMVEVRYQDEIREEAAHPIATIYDVMDYDTKTHLVVCKGHKGYVVKPEPMIPSVLGFWPLQALTFNDVEVGEEDEARTSPFPPSDVFLVKHPQMERNRLRDALRDHREANNPMYIIRQGLLSQEDKDKILNRTPNSIIELKGIPPDAKPSEFITPVQFAPVDPTVYETEPVEHDMELAVGVQSANLGPAQPNVTATAGTIAEQSRMTVSASNIDDLDGFLSRLAKASMEMLLKMMPKAQVQALVGRGAVWPEEDPDTFIHCISISIKAASSGKPNKAIETRNFEQLAPILMQAGANPIALIEEGVRRLGDHLDVQKFFPQNMMNLAQQAGSMAQQPAQPQIAQSSQSDGAGQMLQSGG